MNEDASRAERLRHVIDLCFDDAWPNRLGVAVSGGGDSMALLHLLIGQGRAHGVEVRAVTVEHGLRAEARDEAAMVAAFCAERGVAQDILRWSGWDGRGNLQAMAREARYGLIRQWALACSVSLVAVGHTLDDQAETVLMGLARRSGVDGLAGMAGRFERDGLAYVRPLIGQRRQDLRAYLESQGIGWCEDPSNEDEHFERVRVRRTLETLAELGVDAEVLADVAGHARSARSALDSYAWREVVERAVAEEDRGDIVLSTGSSPPVPAEVMRRILIGALRWISGAPYAPRSTSIASLDSALVTSDRHTLSGCLVSRMTLNDGQLRVTREFNAVKALHSPTDTLWDGRWRLDGPHEPGLEVRALGEAISDTPWRETGLPRRSLAASPAVWRGDGLIAAPVAGLSNGWTARATGRGNFADFLLSR